MLRVFLTWKTTGELNPKVASEGRLQPVVEIRRVSALSTLLPLTLRSQTTATGRVLVLTTGRFLANQSRSNSLRAGNKTGAQVGRSQQLMDTLGRPCGADLVNCLSALARQSNQTGASRQ